MKRVALSAFLIVLAFAAPVYAQTTPTENERQIGNTDCKNGASSSDFDTLAQCTSTASSTGTMQKSPMFIGQVTSPPYTATTCDSSKAGMLQSTGTTFQACNGTSWITFAGGGPTAFAFTDQTGVNTSATISSNAVTLTGFAGTLTATCGTGCTAIARNGSWGGTSVSGFAAGDTIAIRQTSSSSAGTATTASVTVGSVTSGTWTVTTSSTNPDAFSFTNQTDVSSAQSITSNAVTLSGFSGTLTATCGSGCTAIGRNGVWGGTSMTGFASGDTIAIRQFSSATTGTATTATVTVGSTTSGTWTVTTTSACQTGISIGDDCPDGTIYAGLSPDGNVPMYTTPCDAGSYINGVACAACASGLWSGSGTTCSTTYSISTSGLVTWNNGTGTYTTTGYTSVTTGKDNTTGLAALSDGGNPYNAASYCENLTAFGKSDWYLPARNELSILYNNHSSIGNFNTGGTYYWSSTEYNSSNAYLQRFSDGYQGSSYKYNTYLARCARR